MPGSRCLDAFAGTGALGLEALSQGAAEVVFIESAAGPAASIQNSLAELAATGGKVLHNRVPDALATLAGRFDIIFLDPPFGADLLPATLTALPRLLAPGNRVYLEFSAADAPPFLPENWRVLRDKTAGDVGYRLATWAPDGDTRGESSNSAQSREPRA